MRLKKLERTTSLKEKVFNALLEGIIEGSLAPGEPLVEQAIATEFGVSKSPVRRH